MDTTQQTLLVYSRDSHLTSELAPLVNSRYAVRACDSAEEVHDLLRQVQPSGLLADLRNLSSDRTEANLIRELETLLPNIRMAVLTDHDRSTMLGDVLRRENVLCVDRIGEMAKIVSYLLHEDAPAGEDAASTPSADAASEPPPAPEPRIASNSNETVLSGVTRKFETYSAEVKRMLNDLEVAARHDVTILLIGETGAGKTFLSRLIHEVSPRRNEPFMPLACGALPADLIESELFGHVKGAFTSAHADKEGKFLAVRRGTLLLDEIDVLGLEQQVKLLRVIETGEFEPVGSNQTYRCEGRLVVASNLDLPPLVEQGRFRPDLYYRLNMLKFVVPPLRKRREDIVPLARKFVRAFSTKHGIAIDEIDSRVFTILMNYPWPGNVRELENVMQRAVIYCRDRRLLPEHLPPYLVEGHVGPANDASVTFSNAEFDNEEPDASSLGNQIAVTEKEIIEHTLQRNGYSRTRSAKELGISRVTLYNKMKKYKIQ